MNTTIKPEKNNTFCYYPFYALAMKMFSNENLVKVAPCCKMHDLGHSVLPANEIQNLDPEEIFEHENFEKLRYDCLNGIRNSNCEVCWRQEDKDIKSYRLTSSWVFEDEFMKNLREFDVSFSNKCNLSCRMCNLGGTHQLYKDKKFFEKENLLDEIHKATSGATFPNISINTENNFQLNWLIENNDKIKMLQISGGEPLYDKKVLTLLEKMVDDDTSKNCIIQFHTNATLLTPENVELLNKFKQQSHVFSVDGTGKTYEYIRHNSSFDLIENNILYWLYNSNNIRTVSFNLVLSALNVLNLHDYLDWIGSVFSYKHRIRVHVSEIRPFTRGISLHNLPIDLLELSKERIINFFKNDDYELLSYEKDNIIKMINLAIHKNFFDKNKNQLKNEIVLFDKSRNQSYHDYLDPFLVRVLDSI